MKPGSPRTTPRTIPQAEIRARGLLAPGRRTREGWLPGLRLTGGAPVSVTGGAYGESVEASPRHSDMASYCAQREVAGS